MELPLTAERLQTAKTTRAKRLVVFAEGRNLALRSASNQSPCVYSSDIMSRISMVSLLIIVTGKITVMSINHKAEEPCVAKNKTQYGTENGLSTTQALSYLRDMK